MTFEYTFTKKEVAALKRFKKKYPVGPYTLSFSNTGIGVAVSITDYETGVKENITDYGSW